MAAEVLGKDITNGVKLGQNASHLVGFYGTTAISQRANSWQATSLVGTASSTDVTTDVKACIIEIMTTLKTLGLWKGSL